jgi:hypothetical protein
MNSGLGTLAVAVVATMVAAATAMAQQGERNPADIAPSAERCVGLPDGAARIACYQQALGPGAASSRPTDAWRLVRSRDPRGGPDAVSMMRTADTAASDLDLAGVMLRCGEQGPQMRVVVLTPFPLRARPEVVIATAASELRFDATVVPPGAELLLPTDPAVLAAGPLRAVRQIAIRINEAGSTIKGNVVIEGLGTALATLSANCANR